MRTTINICTNLKERLKYTSDILDISTHELITLLLHTISSKNIFTISTFKGIKYQDSDPEMKWSKLHVIFEPQVYEKGLDLRKCFKFSLSFLISFAIIHFLDELVEKLSNSEDRDKIMDNYPLNYIFITKNYNGIPGYIVIWGIPEGKYLENLIP